MYNEISDADKHGSLNNAGHTVIVDGSAMPFEECMDNLLHTRDISAYLDILTALRERYLIVLSVKDITGHKMPEQVFDKIHKLGFSKLTKWLGRTYVGVIDRGKVIFDKTSEKISLPTEFYYDNGLINLSAVSQPNTWGKAEIILNGENHSMNCRGWNIVVFDYESGMVIDSSSYDSYIDHPTFYHRNLDFNEPYFDNHFFIPEKYREIWRQAYRKSYFSNAKLQVRELENGIILPNRAIGDRVYGGVCDGNFNLIAGHITHDEEVGTRVRYISGSYKVEENEIEYLDESVVYCGPMMNHLGHLIVELFMSRFWWYLQNPDTGLKIAVTLYAGSSSKSDNFIKEFFEFSGISDEQLIIVDKPTRFKKIIIADQCIVPLRVQVNYSFTNEFSSSFEKLRLSVTPSKHKKIFFSKSKAGRGNIIGEKYFLDFYRKMGYTIINPEDYTLREKVAFCAGADEFASIIGTNAHFTVFCKPTCKITLLSRTDNYPHPVQAFINESIKNKNLYCVNVSIGFFHKYDWDGLSFMGVTTEFVKYVKEVFNECLDITPEQYLKDNLYDYFSYILDYYSSPINFNYLKNQKMITVLQNMSEVFLGKDFDTSKLDLTTNEDVLRDQVKQLTADLDNSKKRVSGLENSDVYKIANLLEKQVGELQNALDKISALQSKNEELSKESSEFAKTVFSQKEAFENQIRDFKLKEKRLQNDLRSAEEANKKLLTKIENAQSESADFQKQVSYYEHSRSWKITKPLRSIAWFFRRLFGKTK